MEAHQRTPPSLANLRTGTTWEGITYGQYGDSMNKKATTTKATIGIGQQRIKFVAKELRKQYGPMLKRLAG